MLLTIVLIGAYVAMIFQAILAVTNVSQTNWQTEILTGLNHHHDRSPLRGFNSFRGAFYRPVAPPGLQFFSGAAFYRPVVPFGTLVSASSPGNRMDPFARSATAIALKHP